jgi:hypothetical protein
MVTSETVKSIYKDIIEMQKELRDIGKDSKGYGYNYTSFDSLVQYLRPLMTKHNLGFIQSPTDRGLTTRIIHTSGEWIEETMETDEATLKGMNLYQAIGSKITYYRRYMLSSMVGIASDEDIDASDKKFATKPTKQPAKSKPTTDDDGW